MLEVGSLGLIEIPGVIYRFGRLSGRGRAWVRLLLGKTMKSWWKLSNTTRLPSGINSGATGGPGHPGKLLVRQEQSPRGARRGSARRPLQSLGGSSWLALQFKDFGSAVYLLGDKGRLDFITRGCLQSIARAALSARRRTVVSEQVHKFIHGCQRGSPPP
jgi:hypothetical protein